VKRDTLRRTYQDVRKTEEDTFWFETGLAITHWFDARLRLDSADREASGFDEQGNFSRAENPLMRKFNMADRDRNRVTAELDFMPTANMSLTLSYYATDDSYNESVLGLRESEESSLNLDFTYLLGKETSIYAFYSDETIDAELSGQVDDGTDPWHADTGDDIQTWGVGINGRFKERFSYGFDYVSSESDGNILTDSGAGEGPFPVLATELQNARVYLNFKVSERWGLGIDAYHEKYDTKDWYLDGIGPTDITGVLTLGEISPNYSANVVRLLATLTL
jgi:MtrB/PioB family decaheme-associated outer membrane protein